MLRSGWTFLKKTLSGLFALKSDSDVPEPSKLEKQTEKFVQYIIKKYDGLVFKAPLFADTVSEVEGGDACDKLVQILFALTLLINEQNEIICKKVSEIDSDDLTAEDIEGERSIIGAVLGHLKDILTSLVQLEYGVTVLASALPRLFNRDDSATLLLTNSIFEYELLSKSKSAYYKLITMLWMRAKSIDLEKQEELLRSHYSILLAMLRQLMKSEDVNDRLQLIKIIKGFVGQELNTETLDGNLLAKVVLEAETDAELELILRPLVEEDRYAVLGYMLTFAPTFMLQDISEDVFYFSVYRMTDGYKLTQRILNELRKLNVDYLKLIVSFVSIVNRMRNDMHRGVAYAKHGIYLDPLNTLQYRIESKSPDFFDSRLIGADMVGLANIWLNLAEDSEHNNEEMLQQILKKIMRINPDGIEPDNCIVMFYFVLNWTYFEDLEEQIGSMIKFLGRSDEGYVLLARLLMLADFENQPERLLYPLLTQFNKLDGDGLKLVDKLTQITEKDDDPKIIKRIKMVFANMLHWLVEHHLETGNEELVAAIKTKIERLQQ